MNASEASKFLVILVVNSVVKLLISVRHGGRPTRRSRRWRRLRSRHEEVHFLGVFSIMIHGMRVETRAKQIQVDTVSVLSHTVYDSIA